MLKRLLQLTIAALLMGLAGCVLIYFVWIKPYLPNITQISNLRLDVPMQVYTQDEVLFAQFGERKRSLIDKDSIPDKLKAALLSIEDSRFYQHNGIDLIALIRATVSLLLTGDKSQGGSTITMQLARNFFLTREKSYIRKLREIFLAWQIESVYSKEEILALYMNRVFLGHRSYGFKAAALTYFDKTIEQLNWAEAALLAGLPKAPSTLNPVTNPEKAEARRNLVLDQLLKQKFITPQQHQQALSKPMLSQLHLPKYAVDAGHVAEMARSISQKYLPDLNSQDGIRVYTTIQSNYQQAAVKAVQSGLINYIKRSNWVGPADTQVIDFDVSPITETVTNKLINLTQRIDAIVGFERAIIFQHSEDRVHIMTETGQLQELNESDISWAKKTWRIEESTFSKAAEIVKDYTADINYLAQTKQAKMFLIPKLINRTKTAQALQQPLPIGGLIYVQKTAAQTYQLVSRPEVQSALISVDVTNGAIQALVGGFNYVNFKFNRAIQANRQPGSNFKPFLYATALAHGMTAASVINDAPITFQDTDTGFIWTPQNYSKKYFGPTRLRQALVRSRNLVSVRLANQLGIKQIIDFSPTFGFTSIDFKGHRNLSMSLGSAPMSPLKIVRGYSTFANGGYLIEPYIIDRIEDSQGVILYQHQPKLVCYQSCLQLTPEQLAPRTLDSSIAYIMYDMLAEAARSGTGRKARALKRDDIAGKTGTSNDQVDAWFSGFNRQIATTVWVGNDNPQSMGRYETGAQSALPIWIDYMRQVLPDTEPNLAPQPNDLIRVRIDRKTGRFTKASDTKTTLLEIFRTRYAPSASGRLLPRIPSNPIHSGPDDSLVEQLYR